MKPLFKSQGDTRSERYLARLCERAFLSLWSYPNVYTAEAHGRELCDLLVVFGDDVIIFSDKDIRFDADIDMAVAWKRWRKRAVLKSISQLWGAEKVIRDGRPLFVDRSCQTPFPLLLPNAPELRMHLIAVTKNSTGPASDYFSGGSSGSFMLQPLLNESEILDRPFSIGDFDSKKTFVHVFDEMSLDLVFQELDTISDFIGYLTAKEQFLRREKVASIAGEEELLACYLSAGGRFRPGILKMPKLPDSTFAYSIGEGLWQDYLWSDDRKRWKLALEPSYFWDSLIEEFARHIFAGTVAVEADQPRANHEKAVRWMARECRVSRKVLAEQFIEKMQSTPSGMMSSRVCVSNFNRQACFVLALFPRDEDEDYEQYRADRIARLEAYGLVTKWKYPFVRQITVVGTEPRGGDGRSHDVLTMEIESLSAEDRAAARKLSIEGGILRDVQRIKGSSSVTRMIKGVPTPGGPRMKVGRNDLCPCGSGRKFKKCCERSRR